MGFWPAWLPRQVPGFVVDNTVETSAWYTAMKAWMDRCFESERKVAEWRERALAAEARIDDMRAERLKLDRRIHNQRVALRQNWEIVEMRRNYMGSPASRAAYARLLRRCRELLEAPPHSSP